MKRQHFSKILVPLMILAAAACTKKEEAPVQAPAAPGAAVQAAAEADTNIQISAIEPMAFDKKEITVPTGKDITLTLKNNSTALAHNWVLTQPGKNDEVGMDGIKAGEAKGFIPDNPNVIAHTKLVSPNQSDTVTFKAPPAGDYPFICTNAGHHTVMKGVLHSK